jgi:hypothetical protein
MHLALKTVWKERLPAIDQIRRTAKPLPKGMTINDLIEEGRR